VEDSDERLHPNRFFRCTNGEVDEERSSDNIDLPSSCAGIDLGLANGEAIDSPPISNSKYICDAVNLYKNKEMKHIEDILTILTSYY